MAAKKAAAKQKPVADLSHPNHPIWEVLLRLATAVGPGVVGLVSPENAELAQKLGKIATAAEDSVTVGSGQ